MSKTVQTKSNRETFILKKMLARGGEGEIWTVEGKSDFIAKIFLKPDLELEKKLDYMVSHPPQDRVMEKFKFPSIAWPTSLLYNNSKFAGYLMPRVSGSLEIIEVYNPTLRKKYPEFNWKALVHVASNLATAVHTLHQYKYVIGDINPKNIFVARQTTLVTIIDTDSFQVIDGRGNTYLCKVATPLFIPPELTNTNDVRKPEHDYFGLGVMIFYLLMEGFHPFSGSLKRDDDSITQIEEYLLAQKIFPYEKNNPVASPQPHAPSYSILPQDIQNLFHRCFATGLSNPATRPNAREWLEALKSLENSVVECRNNHSHYYSKHLSYCPWCHKEIDIIQEPLKPPPQPKPPPVSPQPKPVPPPSPRPTPSTSAFWPVAIILGIICFVCGVIVLPNMWGTGSADVGMTATAQARVTATAERKVTHTAQALAGASDSEKQVATAEARTTATAERRVTLTTQALADMSASQKQTATAQASATAIAKRRQTATAQARATATAERRVTLTAQAIAETQNEEIAPPPSAPACSQSVTGQFKSLWNKYRRELGCPHQARELGADTVYFVEQWFEKGHMFFFSSAPVYLVIAKYGTVQGGQPGTGTWQSFSSEPWSGKDENFCNEGNGLDPPIYDNFNRVWCFEPGVREKIGYPKDIDSRVRARLYGANNAQHVLAQGFDNGFILRDSDGAGSGLAYVFLNNGNYIRDYYK